VESFLCPKKVSTWSYKAQYGIAEFQPGMEEPVEVPVAAEPETPEPVETETETKEPAAIEYLEDGSSEDGYSVLQKGLFFVVIIGCVAMYIRMSNKKNKRYLP